MHGKRHVTSQRESKNWPRLYRFYLASVLHQLEKHAGGRGEVTVNRDEPADSHWLTPRSYDDVAESPEVQRALVRRLL